MPLRIGETFAGYRVLRLLGSGGMGEVYLVQHPRLPRRDALKILRPDISTESSFRDRFIREADLAAGLRHPHIVGIHDRGEQDGQLWIAMDHIEGADTAQLIEQRYPAGMPVDLVVQTISAVASALDYAHRKGLLHRDVKPANIIVAELDTDDPGVFLADFGIARPLDDPAGLTATNFTFGTFAYSAPEQLMGKDINGRADQYALAATAHHLLTGTPIYSDSNPVAVISHHLTEAPPAPSSIRAGLAPFDHAIARALAKKPEDRFPRCQDFANAMTAVAGNSGLSYAGTAPTEEAPVPSAEDGITAGGSRSLKLAVFAVVALLGLIAGATVLWHKWTEPDETPSPRSTSMPPQTTAATTAPPTTTMTLAPPSPPTPALPSPTQSTSTPARPTYPPAGALGSACPPPGGAIGTGPDGAIYYCSRVEYTDGYEWSLTPGVIPNTNVTITPYTPPPPSEVNPLGPAPMVPCDSPGAVAPGTLGLMECKQIFAGGGWFWGVASR